MPLRVRTPWPLRRSRERGQPSSCLLLLCRGQGHPLCPPTINLTAQEAKCCAEHACGPGRSDEQHGDQDEPVHDRWCLLRDALRMERHELDEQCTEDDA